MLSNPNFQEVMWSLCPVLLFLKGLSKLKRTPFRSEAAKKSSYFIKAGLTKGLLLDAFYGTFSFPFH